MPAGQNHGGHPAGGGFSVGSRNGYHGCVGPQTVKRRHVPQCAGGVFNRDADYITCFACIDEHWFGFMAADNKTAYSLIDYI
jgi:hypothetical protein